jgi:hypothetical protein
MKKEEFSSKLKEIGSQDDITKIREQLLELEKEALKDYDERDTFSNERDELRKNNETLREANMKLFLQVGSDKQEPEVKKDNGGSEKLEFKNLFNEKGELK